MIYTLNPQGKSRVMNKMLFVTLYKEGNEGGSKLVIKFVPKIIGREGKISKELQNNKVKLL